MQRGFFSKRLVIIFVVLFSCLTLLFARCLYFQVFQFANFSHLAKNQQSTTIILESQRGKILDSERNILATNLAVESVYAEPHRIKNLNQTVRSLKEILNLEEEFILDRLKQQKYFVWLKRKISKEEVKALGELDLKGIGFLKESKRYYPMNNLASHAIGIASIDNVGLEGLELYYNDYLKGTAGYKQIIRDARLRELAAFTKLYMPAVNGFNLVLTIDAVIQNITEEALREGISKFNAKAAVAIVMNPYSGEILAMASLPDFNPNFYNDYPIENRRNKNICDIYEPGSAFKIVTASAALEEDLVSLEDLFYCEEGAYRVSRHLLHDHRPHGWLSFREVIEYSSNIGTVKVAQNLKEKTLYSYVRSFGFGALCGVDLPGEVAGFIKPPSQWSKISIAAIPIGHEVGVTALQMVSAISVIANGGYLVRPYIVAQLEDDQGQIIKTTSPKQIRRRVISGDTCQYMKEILKGVVENGTGKRARLEHFSTAGKTGTAQKIEPSGRYSHSKYMATFIGFAPVENPRVAICVIFDEPRPIYYGGSVAAPVFAKICDATLKYLKAK